MILAAQVALISLVCLWPTFRLMGRDYDAAVMSSGFCGFMLGTTANAMANMGVLVEKYGPAPRAYLVVPMAGGLLHRLSPTRSSSRPSSTFGNDGHPV